jgi:DNA-binding Lrp family transcriptional regulator
MHWYSVDVMAVNGFILITAQAGKEFDVQKALSKINGLSERYTIHHEFDFLVIVNAEDSASLERFVTDVIKPIPGIAGTKTILGIAVGPAARLRAEKLTKR